jgi:hypothetical protein
MKIGSARWTYHKSHAAYPIRVVDRLYGSSIGPVVRRAYRDRQHAGGHAKCVRHLPHRRVNLHFDFGPYGRTSGNLAHQLRNRAVRHERGIEASSDRTGKVAAVVSDHLIVNETQQCVPQQGLREHHGLQSEVPRITSVGR